MSPAYRRGAQVALEKLAISTGLGHKLDIAGLGVLAVPALHNLLRHYHPDENATSGRVMAGSELGGLGLLAAKPIMDLLAHARRG